ncbi:hypothetical protein T484DRAFT_1893283, partial [Baffinella frigidus]
MERLRGGVVAADRKKWSKAIGCFTDALSLLGESLTFISEVCDVRRKRARAYIRRGWAADAELALRDCDMVLAHSPAGARTDTEMLRLKCLKQLALWDAASAACTAFRETHGTSEKLSKIEAAVQRGAAHRARLRLQQEMAEAEEEEEDDDDDDE